MWDAERTNFYAGVIAAAFVCPLDVIKTRFQVHGLPQLPNGSVKGTSCLVITFVFPFKIDLFLWTGKTRNFSYEQ